MKTILIISFTDLDTDPRTNRQIRFLKDDYRLIAVGVGDPKIEGVEFIPVTPTAKSLVGKVVSAGQLLLRQPENYYWRLDHVTAAMDCVSRLQPDLIIANNIDPLPMVLKLPYRPKIVFDAYEYFPRFIEDELIAKHLFGPYYTYICQTYIPQVDAMITVSEGIAAQYEADTGVRPVVITNAPNYHDLEPNLKPEQTRPIRLIYHGVASPERKHENLIELMDYLDDRFELDLLLIASDPRYMEKLKAQGSRNPKIRFLPPVPMRQLVQISSQYDIGLVMLPPTSFNHLHALPNKFFEFIQARLALAIWPSPEMARIVQSHKCGLVAADFTPQALAQRLVDLDHPKINAYKSQSHQIACQMSAEYNKQVLLNLIQNVLEPVHA